jgi:hypothetical protein
MDHHLVIGGIGEYSILSGKDPVQKENRKQNDNSIHGSFNVMFNF